MQAVVTTAFPGRPDDEILTRTIEVGEMLSGDIARLAIERGCAHEPGKVPVVEPVAPLEDDISKLTVEQLKALADEEEIDLGDATKKADLVDIITKQRAEKAAAE